MMLVYKYIIYYLYITHVKLDLLCFFFILGNISNLKQVNLLDALKSIEWHFTVDVKLQYEQVTQYKTFTKLQL